MQNQVSSNKINRVTSTRNLGNEFRLDLELGLGPVFTLR